MNNIVRAIKDIFYPPRCIFCDEVIASNERPICQECLKITIPTISEDICNRCGREKKACVCKRTTFLTDGITAPYYYESVVAEGIKHFKKAEDIDRIEYFTERLTERAFLTFADYKIDLIASVPLHKDSLSERGFDQMYPIAKRLAKTLHTPYIRILRKIFSTEPQKDLDADRRTGNLLGVFDVDRKFPVKNKNVLLIDDVITTGSTTNECAKMLKIYGAKNVYVLAIALSRPDKDDEEDKSDPIAELKERLSGKAGDFT